MRERGRHRRRVIRPWRATAGGRSAGARWRGLARFAAFPAHANPFAWPTAAPAAAPPSCAGRTKRTAPPLAARRRTVLRLARRASSRKRRSRPCRRGDRLGAEQRRLRSRRHRPRPSPGLVRAGLRQIRRQARHRLSAAQRAADAASPTPSRSSGSNGDTACRARCWWRSGAWRPSSAPAPARSDVRRAGDAGLRLPPLRPVPRGARSTR